MRVSTKFNGELPFEPRHQEVLPEWKEQTYVVEWANMNPIARECLLAIFNEGKRSIQRSVIMKRMGLRAGVSDLFMAYPTHGKHGLWIEMKKRRGSKISPEQRTWINRMNSLDYVAVVAYGWEHATKVIAQYLDGTIQYPYEI